MKNRKKSGRPGGWKGQPGKYKGFMRVRQSQGYTGECMGKRGLMEILWFYLGIMVMKIYK